ncbi:unnamed protein product [Brachionus calyciflorus]|uniref:VASt domain-containing protein n=1 Tax=Brachionus calyciflorus TaxID=104777 RepID=A0A813XV96_9BILA|nr:unnamed protein product [Brachionus calyciflorus]
MSIKSSSKNRLTKKNKTIDIALEDKNNNNNQLEKSKANNISLQENGQSILNCNCDDHVGQIYIDRIFDMTFSYLFECLFDFNEFYYEFLKSRKISEFKADDWKIENGIKTRKTDYLIEVNNVIGAKHCKNIEYYRIVKYVENEICIIDTETLSSGIIYADCFNICHRYCLTRCASNKQCKLVVHSNVKYITKPNFLIKSLIDKNCLASLQEFFKGMENSLLTECQRLKMFNNCITKTSTELDLKESFANNLSSSTSTLSSARDFSSDNEISDSDDNNKPPSIKINNRQKSFENSLDLDQTKVRNDVKTSEHISRRSQYIKKRNSNSYSDHNQKNYSKFSHSEIQANSKHLNLNIKSEIFVKFFFFL